MEAKRCVVTKTGTADTKAADDMTAQKRTTRKVTAQKKTAEPKTAISLRERKRTEFEVEDRKNKASTKWTVVAAAAVISLLAVGGFFISTAGTRAVPDRITIMAKQDYTLSNVTMKDVAATVANGEVSLSLADLKKYRLLAFSYKKDGMDVPMLAMVTPSGRLFTGSAKCEPCNSRRFHTEPDGTLTCNACGTKWDLESLQGISGGCPNYPPQEMTNSIRGGRIIIKEPVVRAWRPRTV